MDLVRQHPHLVRRAPLRDCLEFAPREHATGWIVGAGEHQRAHACGQHRVESVEIERAVGEQADVDQLHARVW